MIHKHIVRGASFDADSGGFVIEYLTPTVDIRATGLVLNHALLIPAEDPFMGLLEELEQAIQEALRKGLALHAAANPLLLPELDDDDEPRPYDNPEDRR